MRAIAYDRVKRGVLLVSVGATFLLPAAAAQACPRAWAPAHGYWSRGFAVHDAQSQNSGNGAGSAGAITGHRIG